jgi:hypothetical protein
MNCTMTAQCAPFVLRSPVGRPLAQHHVLGGTGELLCLWREDARLRLVVSSRGLTTPSGMFWGVSEMHERPNFQPIATYDPARVLADALAEAAASCGIWYDPEKQKPMAMISGAPLVIPPFKRDGTAPQVKPTVAAALEGFRQATADSCYPSDLRGTRATLDLRQQLLRRPFAVLVREVMRDPPLALVWRLEHVPAAYARPVSGLDHDLDSWLGAECETCPDCYAPHRDALRALANHSGVEHCGKAVIRALRERGIGFARIGSRRVLLGLAMRANRTVSKVRLSEAR